MAFLSIFPTVSSPSTSAMAIVVGEFNARNCDIEKRIFAALKCLSSWRIISFYKRYISSQNIISETFPKKLVWRLCFLNSLGARKIVSEDTNKIYWWNGYKEEKVTTFSKHCTIRERIVYSLDELMKGCDIFICVNFTILSPTFFPLDSLCWLCFL